MISVRPRPFWCAVVCLLLLTAGCQPTPSPSGPAKPQRIASVNLACDELLAALVPVERVALVTTYADGSTSNVAGWYPPQVKRLSQLKAEELILLQPDLVLIAPYNNADEVEQIVRAGLPVFRYDAIKSMDEIGAGILALGDRLGEPEKAKAVVDAFQARRTQLAQRLSTVKERPRVLFLDGSFTAGRDTTIHDVIVEAGGRNVADELGLKGNVAISADQIVKANPDYVLESGTPGNEISGIYTDAILKQLPAVRAKRVIRIEPRYLSTVTHHLVEASERLARAVHPDCFASGKQP